jgi:hypothetical protein
MTQQNHLPQTLLYSTLAVFAIGAFLVPAGAGLSHLFYLLALALCAGSLAALGYARSFEETPGLKDESLRPSIEWHVVQGTYVPASLLAGSAPLVATIGEGQLPHPEFAATLTPYFAEPTLAFVQGAIRYDGVGGVADAFRLAVALKNEGQHGRTALNAVELWNTGALISRDALRAAWQPGDTWASLGMRMQALGYTGRFESSPMALAWAPQTMSTYAQSLIARTRAAFQTGFESLTVSGLAFETRLQYLGSAAATLSIWAAALMGFFSAFSLVLFNAGPVIVTSQAAYAGDLLGLAALILALSSLYRITSINPVRPTALALAGVYTLTGEYAYRAATSTYVKRAWSVVYDAARATAATARAGGNADTSPAGTPAHS